MIVVRNVFKVKFGQARERSHLWKKGMAIAEGTWFRPRAPRGSSPTSVGPSTRSSWSRPTSRWPSTSEREEADGEARSGGLVRCRPRPHRGWTQRDVRHRRVGIKPPGRVRPSSDLAPER